MESAIVRTQIEDAARIQSKLDEYIEILENIKGEFADTLDRVRAMRNRIGIPIPPSEVKQGMPHKEVNTTLAVRLESVIWNYREILGELRNEIALLEQFA